MTQAVRPQPYSDDHEPSFSSVLSLVFTLDADAIAACPEESPRLSHGCHLCLSGIPKVNLEANIHKYSALWITAFQKTSGKPDE